MKIINAQEWETWLEKFPNAHILQSAEWGLAKQDFGWMPRFIVQDDICGALVLFRRLPMGFSIAYIPKGPVGAANKDFWSSLIEVCRRENAVFLRVEEDEWKKQDDKTDRYPGSFIGKNIQPQRTIVIDLSNGEDSWLKKMKQKTRYNIRVADKKDVIVTESTDVDLFYNLMIETGSRDGFGIHSKAYYQKVFDLFHNKKKAALLIARYQDIPLAGLMVFAAGSRAWYFYGASNDRERNRMPTYLLQWEAMKWAKTQECDTYDLWGVPDFDEKELEEQFMNRSEGLWGVYRFKRGFGGEVMRSKSAIDIPLKPLIYRLYRLYESRGERN